MAERERPLHAAGADADPVGAELPPPEGYRARTAKGVLILSAFRIGLSGFTLARNVALAAFLTREEYGLWGLVLATVITLAFLKQVGISDKYVQQREADQEAAFQKAFTLNLAYSALFFCFVLAVIPLYSEVIYDRPEVLAPAAVVSLTILITALEAPAWVYYRRLEYRKQMTLEAIGPVVTTVVMIALLAAGMEIWGLVIGVLAGSACSALAAVIASPYRLRLRFDRGTLREYVGFSWPLLYSGLGSLLVVQGILIVGNAALGLAAVGMIGLAGNVTRFTYRVEILLKRTLYPAVAAAQDRLDVLRETFEKSNRIGLMWAMPFGIGLTLFATDLVDHVLGSRWEAAIPLLQIFGPIFAAGAIGFAWTTFYQARGDTRPVAVTSTVTVIGFFAVVVPLILTVGVLGYAWGMAIVTAAQLLVRAIYLRRLFPGFPFLAHGLRAILPIIPAVGAVLALRLLVDVDERSLALAISELTLYAVAVAVATWAQERALIAEALGYLRKAVRPAASGTAAA